MVKILVNVFYQPVQKLKDFLVNNSSLYVPINGGASLKHDIWCQKNMLFDDVGDNISNLNAVLNENTSIYWFWKHLDEFDGIDYCGFNHYRRFFTQNAIDTCSSYDLTVSQPIRCPYSLEWQYGYYHNIDDLEKCVSFLKKHDHLFGSMFEEYLKLQTDNFAPMNMFIMKKELFQQWCSFIFPVLLQLKDIINVMGRDNYQKRAICFLEERIFGFWCWMQKNINGLKVAEMKIDEHLEWKNNKLNERGTYG